MRNMNTKALTMSLLVAIIMLLPFAASAQRSDSFFSGFEDDDYENRIASFIGLGNQPFGTEPAPVGSGLLVLTVAGAGYAALKRKRSDKSGKSHKTYTTCVLALAMVLAFTGCKKKIEPIVNSGETVHINLNIANGGRHEILLEDAPGYSPVNYKAGDSIYVGHNGKFQGILVCQSDGGPFSGDITAPNEGDTMYFYFLGKYIKRRISADPVKGTTESFTIDISNQKSMNSYASSESLRLPVLSIGKAQYIDETTNYSAILYNKCVLVQFKFKNTVSESQDRNIKITNMLSEAKIDFKNPGITPTGKVDAITLYAYYKAADPTVHNYNNRWAILLPSDKPRNAFAVDYSTNPHTYYNIDIPPMIINEYLYHSDHALQIVNESDNETKDKLFVVSNNGNVVRFSKGNLQYRPSTQTWRLAERQWDFVGDASKGTVSETIGGVPNTKCNNASIAENYEGWIDLFGWGTWGNGGNPCNTSTTPNEYTWSGDFEGSLDGHSDWRTLTKSEWAVFWNNYLGTGNKWGPAQILDKDNNVMSEGLVFIPDNAGNYEFATQHKYFSDNTFSLADWNNMEKNYGAVFLPRAYRRWGLTMSSNHYYWSSSQGVYDGYAGEAAINATGLNVADFQRPAGSSVRLVR